MPTANVVCPKCGKINKIPSKPSYVKVNCGQCKASLMDTKPIVVTESSFSQYVAGSSLPVVVDFWADWCGPCRMMAPAFEQAASALPLKVQFLKLNTEEHHQLSAKYGIRSLPTMVIFRDGTEIDRVSGAMSSDQILQWIDSKI